MQKQEIEYEVRCKKCGYRWVLNPKMWKNLENILHGGKKRIFCPSCLKRHFISNSEALKILESAGVEVD